MTVLHITPWYPTNEQPYAALWIKRHIDAIRPYGRQIVWNVCTNHNSLRFNYSSNDLDHLYWNISIPTKRWFIIELFCLFQLMWLAIFKRKAIRNCDIVNFHIAYPNLTYWKLLKYVYPKKVVITEHWSAYHYNFGVRKKLPRVIEIFRNRIPVITVSNALKRDIEIFANTKILGKVIPNVVDANIFNFKRDIVRDNKVFYMVSLWAYPKNPVGALKEFHKLLSRDPKAILRIAGYGPLEYEIKNYIKTNNLESNITFLGNQNPKQIANEFNNATAFIHLTDYETFSVVCAEAICCGCPVIASNVGGIREFIDDKNGILIDSIDDLSTSILEISARGFERSIISKKAIMQFRSENVGNSYFNYLQSLV